MGKIRVTNPYFEKEYKVVEGVVILNIIFTISHKDWESFFFSILQTE